MYKTKLLELCHHRAWNQPDYVTTKQGPDHNPRFQASVTVNGLPFHSQSFARSSKQAQNDVAKLALDHFSFPPPPPPPPAPLVSSNASADFSSSISSGRPLKLKVEKTNQIPEGNGPEAETAKNDRLTEAHKERSEKKIKTKLQELCHQRALDQKEYAAKEGTDHNPQFQATLIDNCLSFPSHSPTKSSKRAQNDVAKLAFDHISCSHSSLPPLPAMPVSLSTSTDFSSNISHGQTSHFKVEGTNQIPEENGPATTARINDSFTDIQHLCKNQLQTYAQKRSFTLPVYSCERVGPPHASRFKCKVTINGKTYESQEFYLTLSKAEHAAAKAALTSLAPNGVEEDEYAYKNLLQELAQKECYRLPTYSTVKSGEAHSPTFVSTVDVKGELFTGREVRIKKHAEFSAAKVAYTALKQLSMAGNKVEERKRVGRGSSAIRSQGNSRQAPMVSGSGNSSLGPVASLSANSSQSSMLSCSGNSSQSPVTYCSANLSQSSPYLTPPQQGHKVIRLNSSSSPSNLTTYLQQYVQPRMPRHDEQAEEDRATADVVSGDPPIASPGPEGSSSTSLPESGLSTSFAVTDSTTYSAASNKHPVGTNISGHPKVIVHPPGANVTYPPGSMVLLMSDDNWVAVGTPQSS